MRTVIFIAASLALATASAAAPLGTPELQAFLRSTEPAPRTAPSAVGIAYNSFAARELPTCFQPSTATTVTTEMGVHRTLVYATSRDDLFRQLHIPAAQRMGLGDNAASPYSAIARDKLGTYHRFAALRIVVRGKGHRLVRNGGWLDGVSQEPAAFFTRCGDKFAREVYPAASLTIVFSLLPANEQDTVAMDVRGDDKKGDTDDAATLVANLRAIRGNADWRTHAETIGFDRAVPPGDFDRLLTLAENFDAAIDKCRAGDAPACSDDTSFIDAARSGEPPVGSFLVMQAATYDDYKNEIGAFDASQPAYVLNDLSDHFTALADQRDSNSPFLVNTETNYWPPLTAGVRETYEKSLDEALAKLAGIAGACGSNLAACRDPDMTQYDQLLEGNPSAERFGLLTLSDLAQNRQNQPLAYIAEGRIGLVDFIGTLSAPGGAPFKDARDTNLVELRLRSPAGIVDPNHIRFLGQTCVKGPATVIYWPVGLYDYTTYQARDFRARIWIVDAKEEANLPKGTECYVAH